MMIIPPPPLALQTNCKLLRVNHSPSNITKCMQPTRGVKGPSRLAPVKAVGGKW